MNRFYNSGKQNELGVLTLFFVILLNSFNSFAQTPVNDSCQNAIVVNCGDIITGSTVNAHNDGFAQGCNGVNPQGHGVWYLFIGDGSTVIASLCNGTNYDSKINAYSGDCSALVCEGGDDDFCNLQSEISFSTTVGVNYYILISGYQGANGDFQLEISCIPPLTNDACADAVVVQCGDVVLGSTIDAHNDPDAPNCVGVNPQGHGVWYRYSGDGSAVTFSLCNGTDYDSEINVYSGDCNNLTCVNANDDFCGLQSQVTCITSVGIDYFILVSGYQGDNGNFQLEVTCAAGLVNDSCQHAIAVSCGDVVTGSTEFATVDDNAIYCGTNPQAPGVWYVLTGNNSIVTASLCASSYNTKINIYTGDCTNFVCVTGNNNFCGNRSEVTFPTFTGVNYYILVNGKNNITGDFILEITCSAVQSNDIPCDAFALSIGTNGPYSNSSATTDTGEPAPMGGDCIGQNSWCDNVLENTLWFTFVAPASGGIIINSQGFDTQLAIWDAIDCNAILTGGATLIAANDNDANYLLHGGVQFSSYILNDCLTPGHTYYIQLDGYLGATGITNIILSDPGSVDASFTLNSRYCPIASPVTLVPVTLGGTFSGPGISGTTFNPAVAGIGGPYEIIYSFGCIADTLTTTVESPVADITPDGPVTYCYGLTSPLTTPFDADYQYTWKRYSVTVATGTNTFTPVSSGIYKYSVKVIDILGGGCSSVDTVWYKIINFPNPTLIVGACINNTILLSSSVTDPDLNYQWVKWNTPISGATNTSYLVTSNGGYRIAITDSCGTLRFTPLTVFNVSTCRIEELTEEQAEKMIEIVLYPNPSEGQFTIDLNAYDLSSSDVNVEIFNLLGQVVYSKILTSNNGKLNATIQLPSNVENGLYNVRIRNGNYETYTKIVVSE